MATLGKRAHGVYYIYFMDDVIVTNPDGTRRAERKHRAVSTGLTDRREAQEFFREWEKQYRRKEAQRRLGLGKKLTISITVEDLWEEYRAWAAGSIKPKTLESYARSVRSFSIFLNGNTDLARLEREDVERFIAERSAAGSHAANLDIRQLRVVFNWGAGRGLVPAGLMGGVKEKRLTKKEPVVLSDAQALALFAAADQVDRERAVAGGQSLRLGLFCRLSYFQGLRVSEALSLTMRGVHPETGTISVLAAPELGFTTKTYQERTISACPEVLRLIEAAGPFDATGALVGYRATDGAAWKEDWTRALEISGLKAIRFTASHFRKNFALRFLQLTGSEQLTRIMMGHSSGTDTLIKYYLPRANMYTRTEIWDAEWIGQLKQRAGF